MDATATIAPGPQHLQALSARTRYAWPVPSSSAACRDGEISAAEVILESPWEAESMAVADLLMSQRRWGSTRCRKFLAQIPVAETKTIGIVTDRQRQASAALLEAPQAARARARARRR